MPFKCTTCNVDVLTKENFVKFACPNCGEVEIVRCFTCKNLSNKYICKSCQFTGP